jgi:hypothetical protein
MILCTFQVNTPFIPMEKVYILTLIARTPLINYALPTQPSTSLTYKVTCINKQSNNQEFFTKETTCPSELSKRTTSQTKCQKKTTFFRGGGASQHVAPAAMGSSGTSSRWF